jgi:hypothetical protein
LNKSLHPIPVGDVAVRTGADSGTVIFL